MRRLALLAAAVLGSGCISHGHDTTYCAAPTITVQWSTFTAGDGAQLTCQQAGVAFVDIYTNGNPVARWNCTDLGATITQVAAGSYTLTVEGLESTGRIAFRDEFAVTTAATCGDTLVAAHPAEGWVDLAYSFATGPTCFANPSYIWFAVYDDVLAGVTAQVDQTTAPRTYACGDPAGLVFPLPAGPHRLQWIEERIEPSPGTFAVTGANCTLLPFTVTGGITNTVPVVLADTTVACTH